MRSNNRIFQRKMLFTLIIFFSVLLVLLLIGVWLLGRNSDTPAMEDGPPGGTTFTQQTQVSTNPEQNDPTENTPEVTVPSSPTDHTLPSTVPDIDKPQTQDPPPDNPPPAKIDPPSKTDPPIQKDPPTEEIQLEVERFARFSGQFVENGSDVFVDHVVAILVKNPSDRFLDLGTVVYEIDGKPPLL